MRSLFSLFSLSLIAVVAALPIHAQAAETDEVPTSTLQAIVLVQCDRRQGSGTVLNAQDGYILTNAHVVLNLETKQPPARGCTAFFYNPTTGKADIPYRTTIIRSTFDEATGRDFAILQIGSPITRTTVPTSFPSLMINPFPSVGDRAFTVGYVGSQIPVIERGFVQRFNDGYIQTSAIIRPGNSGGAGINAQSDLIGIPTRVVTISEEQQVQQTRYELVDIRAVLTWLETFGPGEPERLFQFRDLDRYKRNAVFIEQTSLDCEHVVKLPDESTVYCLTINDDRLIFPNGPTYLSWFADFRDVETTDLATLGLFPIRRNATYRPGTLVKAATSPKVYVVVDTFGTMRWIPNEETARTLWGENWASFIHDIPDAFYGNYTVGLPLATTLSVAQ